MRPVKHSGLGLLALFSMFIMILVHPQTAYGAQTLPPGMVIGDESGIYATQEGDYFIDLPAVLPGEVYEKEIVIRSLDLEEPFSLGLLVESVEQSGPIDFNKYITVTLKLDGEEIYSGPLLGDESFDWTLQPLELGTCEYGTDKVLQATFKISGELTSEDYKEASKLLYYWTFVGTKDYVEPPATSDSSSSSSSTSQSSSSSSTVQSTTGSTYVKPKPSGSLPQTGEDVKNMMYKILVGFILIIFVLVIWKRKKKEE